MRRGDRFDRLDGVILHHFRYTSANNSIEFYKTSRTFFQDEDKARPSLLVRPPNPWLDLVSSGINERNPSIRPCNVLQRTNEVALSRVGEKLKIATKHHISIVGASCRRVRWVYVERAWLNKTEVEVLDNSHELTKQVQVARLLFRKIVVPVGASPHPMIPIAVASCVDSLVED